MSGPSKRKPIVFYVLGRERKQTLSAQEPLGPLAEPTDHPEQQPEGPSTYDARKGEVKKPRGFFLNRYIY